MAAVGESNLLLENAVSVEESHAERSCAREKGEAQLVAPRAERDEGLSPFAPLCPGRAPFSCSHEAR